MNRSLIIRRTVFTAVGTVAALSVFVVLVRVCLVYRAGVYFLENPAEEHITASYVFMPRVDNEAIADAILWTITPCIKIEDAFPQRKYGDAPIAKAVLQAAHQKTKSDVAWMSVIFDLNEATWNTGPYYVTAVTTQPSIKVESIVVNQIDLK